jgi:hypothetical protein
MDYSSVWMRDPWATTASMIGRMVFLLDVGQHVEDHLTAALDQGEYR